LVTFAPASRTELPLGFEVRVSLIVDWTFVVVASFFLAMGKIPADGPVLASNVTKVQMKTIIAYSFCSGSSFVTKLCFLGGVPATSSLAELKRQNDEGRRDVTSSLLRCRFRLGHVPDIDAGVCVI